MMNSKSVIIGSRGSKLALWQAEWVKKRLEAVNPRLVVEIEIIKTEGDKRKDVPLSVIGGQGAFTKELEQALLDQRIDLAVHSLKDLPTILAEDLLIAAISEREDPRDALVWKANSDYLPRSIQEIPNASVIGTSSPRRLSQLKYLRPDLEVRNLRGNVDTRLRKLDSGEYDGILLASAGLKRLGLAGRITAHISTTEMLPAVGQGALGIETRASDVELVQLLSPINNPNSRACCEAERSLLRNLGGGCQLPIAGHAEINGNELKLEGVVADPSGAKLIRRGIMGAPGDSEKLGSELAALILKSGANDLLSGI
jgi:hydroxymethylbilane synthase